MIADAMAYNIISQFNYVRCDIRVMVCQRFHAVRIQALLTDPGQRLLLQLLVSGCSIQYVYALIMNDAMISAMASKFFAFRLFG